MCELSVLKSCGQNQERKYIHSTDEKGVKDPVRVLTGREQMLPSGGVSKKIYPKDGQKASVCNFVWIKHDPSTLGLYQSQPQCSKKTRKQMSGHISLTYFSTHAKYISKTCVVQLSHRQKGYIACCPHPVQHLVLSVQAQTVSVTGNGGKNSIFT